MNDLVRFLRGRLAEDEAVARAAATDTDHRGDWWDSSTLMATMQLPRADADHIAAHGPVRVLADVQAKRRLIEESIDADQAGEYWNSESREWALRLLALPYAGHPDYRDVWRP